MKINNRGQSLVMFVLIIPIILLVLVLVYDVGNAIYEKNRLSNTCFLAEDYALDNFDSINENDVINYILNDNSELNNISVIFKDNTVIIETEKKIKGVISKNLGLDLIEIKSKYIGSINNEKKNIERIK